MPKKVKGDVHICNNQLETLEGCSEIANKINKYLIKGDILWCQSELINAGLEEYAKL